MKQSTSAKILAGALCFLGANIWKILDSLLLLSLGLVVAFEKLSVQGCSGSFLSLPCSTWGIIAGISALVSTVLCCTIAWGYFKVMEICELQEKT